MPAIARVGVDSAGGIILGGGQTTVTANGSRVAVQGDRVAPHGDGPHANATLQEASSSVFAGALRVCRVGDAASCGHVITGGSPNVEAG